MLIQHIVDLLPELARLSPDEQEIIATDIAAELSDAKLRHHLEQGIPMPELDQILQEAQDSEDQGDSVSMDVWLAGGPL